MIHNLYKGEIELEYKDDVHKYFANGKQVESVTEILKVVAKPNLIPWAVQTGIQHIKNEIKEGKYSLEEFDKILDSAQKKHINLKNEASDTGRFFHAWIENHIKGIEQPIPENEWAKKSIENFLNWVKESEITFTESEVLLYSKGFKYAGRADFIARYKDGLILGDIKTSKSIYPEMYLQTAAYKRAYEEERKCYINKRLILHFNKEGELNIVENPNYLKDFTGFKGALNLHRRLKELEE